MANDRQNNRHEREHSDIVDKLVGVRRVAKTVKGGRRMAFGALVVVGDENGRVGWGKGKAKEVPDAVKKATEQAKRGMVRVPLRQGRTVHHEVIGRFGSTRVILKPAVPGAGIIAGGAMRSVFEAMGIKDVVAKALGSTNPYNIIQAMFDAFNRIETPRGIAAKRGLKITDLVLHKEQSSIGEADQKELNEKAAKAKAVREAARKAARPGAGKGRGDRDGGNRGPRRESRDSRKAEMPAVQAVSKAASMKQAVSKPAAEAAPEAAAAEAPKAE